MVCGPTRWVIGAQQKPSVKEIIVYTVSCGTSSKTRIAAVGNEAMCWPTTMQHPIEPTEKGMGL